MSRRKLIKVAKEAALHAGQYAYVGRKLRKRDFRRLWITRISAGVKKIGWSYNQFIHALEEKNIALNRKILAYLAKNDSKTFNKLVEYVRKR